MTVEHLHAWADGEIRSIQNGYGLARDDFPEGMKGQIAKDLWNNSTFSYGMEYGYLLAMLDLKKELLK